jgi:diguanylate cyclase (GGDEF)-like protein/putative nucleotidyltransferase with HDIG domain
MRFEGREAVVVASAAPTSVPAGLRVGLEGESATSKVLRTGAPARVDDYAPLRRADPDAHSHMVPGQASAVSVPVRVRRRATQGPSADLWGALMAGSRRGAVPAPAEDLLERFASLVGTAIANEEARAELVEQAATDPITGLSNHRAFHEAVAAEVERARRHGRPLALAVLDLDHFKDVNDHHGHRAGDAVLAETAWRLAEVARQGDLLARVGGEEFGLLMPETSIHGATLAVERARELVARAPFLGVGHLSLSAGVCDLALATGPEDLIRRADGALAWVKLHGRDAVCVYAPDVVRDLTAEERGHRLARERGLAGLRSLARAVDATDPPTSRHSGRVADLAVALARRLGWDDERCLRLHEVGLIHDVGKIGVPDAVLLKPGRLTSQERSVAESHAVLGAEIAAEILEPEQVGWLRHHHERIDGAGYPDGLAGASVPDGAKILAVAEAWDAMTSNRPFALAVPVEHALGECRRCAGTQFDPDVVAALADVVAEGPGGGRLVVGSAEES